jgi:hypothetical protein
MRSFFFLLLISFSITTIGQSETMPENSTPNTKYYKKYLYKPCSERSAVYKEVTSFEEGIRKEVVTHINSGQVRTQKYFKGKTPVGIWKTYNSVGKLTEETDFSQILVEKCPVEVTDTVGFEEPTYPGGNQAMYVFLGQNMRYPPEARDNNIQGKVYFCVYVDNVGNISVNSAIKEASPYLIMEGKRVLELMDAWNPATRDGVAIDTYMVIPIVFKLQ